MSDRIVEMYLHYQLVAALNNGKFQGRVYKNDKNILDLEGERIADVQAKLRDYVDTIFQ